MKNNKKVNTTRTYLSVILREDLRQRANGLTNRLSRSVARLTSCDPQPCMEYDEEVQFQQDLAQQLFYLQHCRNALERCIGSGAATLRYRWPDGTVSRTTFRKVGQNQVKTVGLKLDADI